MGCASGGNQSPSGSSARGTSSDSAGVFESTRGGQSGAADEAWGIALRFFSGPGHQEQAQRALPALAEAVGTNALRVRTQENGSVVLLGRYAGPGDQRGLAEIERLRTIADTNGNPVFATAYLAPPPAQGPDAGTLPEANLATVRERYGSEAVYTLQHALFDRGSRSGYQREAERLVRELRAQGELAFYYHGRTSSVVTLGIFGEDAVDARNRFSPAVDALQRRFRFAMKNGERVPRPRADRSAPEQFFPTQLVRIP